MVTLTVVMVKLLELTREPAEQMSPNGVGRTLACHSTKQTYSVEGR